MVTLDASNSFPDQYSKLDRSPDILLVMPRSIKMSDLPLPKKAAGGKWYWTEVFFERAQEKDVWDMKGWWRSLGPSGQEKVTAMVKKADMGEKVRLPISPMVTITVRLYGIHDRGVVLIRDTTPLRRYVVRPFTSSQFEAAFVMPGLEPLPNDVSMLDSKRDRELKAQAAYEDLEHVPVHATPQKNKKKPSQTWSPESKASPLKKPGTSSASSSSMVKKSALKRPSKAK